MSKKKPIITKTRSRHTFKTTEEDGLLYREVIQHPDTADGWNAWAKQFTKPLFGRTQALEEIDKLRRLARAVINGGKASSENSGNKFSAYEHARSVDAKLNSLLIDIEEFEAIGASDSICVIFYRSVAKVLYVSDKVNLLQTALLDRDATLGRKVAARELTDGKATPEQRREAVAKYWQLIKGPNALGLTKAQEELAAEYNVSRKTISNWIKKYS